MASLGRYFHTQYNAYNSLVAKVQDDTLNHANKVLIKRAGKFIQQALNEELVSRPFEPVLSGKIEPRNITIKYTGTRAYKGLVAIGFTNSNTSVLKRPVVADIDYSASFKLETKLSFLTDYSRFELELDKLISLLPEDDRELVEGYLTMYSKAVFLTEVLKKIIINGFKDKGRVHPAQADELKAIFPNLLTVGYNSPMSRSVFSRQRFHFRREGAVLYDANGSSKELDPEFLDLMMSDFRFRYPGVL